jgi:hypothetical protein
MKSVRGVKVHNQLLRLYTPADDLIELLLSKTHLLKNFGVKWRPRQSHDRGIDAILPLRQLSN